VAEILGVSEVDARVIVRFHGVQSKDGEQGTVNGRPFGKVPKLYLADEVRAVLEHKIR
jgi:hypothetical protein